MGFLDGLFEQTVPELPIAETVVSADATVETGQLHRISGSDVDLELTMATHSLATVAQQRFAVKVYSAAMTPGALTINAPAGQLLEDADGELVASVALTQALGLYREWMCDDAGNWLAVGGIG